MANGKRNLGAACCLLLLFACLSSHALNAEGEAESRTSISFSTLLLGKDDFEDIRFFQGQNNISAPLEFRLVQRCGPYTYSGPREMVFVREIPAPTDEEPEAVAYEPVARVNIPKGWDEVLFFFEELAPGEVDKEGKLPFKVHMMDDSLSAFPAGSLVVFNACGVPMAGKVGKERARFAPGPAEAINFSNTRDSVLTAAFAIETADGQKLVFENRLEFSENYRIILMLAPPRRAGSIRIQVYNIPQFIEQADQSAP